MGGGGGRILENIMLSETSQIQKTTDYVFIYMKCLKQASPERQKSGSVDM